MLKLLVIADDFTGALDTGVQFSNQGVKTLVSTEMNIDYQSIPEEIQVLVLNTESRHLSFDIAYDKIRLIIESAKHQNIPYIYKKVDSALRGNISSEIKALIDYSDQEVIPFLPAYPEMNRVLVNGHLYINGIPVSESVFSKDPYEPVTESNLLKRFKDEANIEATLVKESNIPTKYTKLLIFDTQTDEMLEKQGNLLEEKRLLNVTVGCAGFAKVLAKQLFPNRKMIDYSLKKPIVVICGSINPITRKQIDYMGEKKHPRISLSGKQLLEPNYWESLNGKKQIKNYVELMKVSKLIIFETFSNQTSSEIIQYSEIYNINSKECRFRIGEALGKLTEQLWLQTQESTFLFTGGDTLFQSMKVLNISAIKPLVEISPGVVLSTIEWNNEEIQVITKSGGFGTENLLEKIML